LEVAKQEINQSMGLHCTHEAKKTGRKVTNLEFKIVRIPFDQFKNTSSYMGYSGKITLHERFVCHKLANSILFVTVWITDNI